MKTLLFIVPSRGNAGTNSSLSCLYNEFKGRCAFKILTMESKGQGTYEFLEDAYTPILLDAYLQEYSNLKGFRKIIAVFVKIIKRLAIVASIDFEKFLFKYVARRIEGRFLVDYVIGFQEGIAMHFAAQFKNPNKITWIHCDYLRAFPTSNDELNLYNRFNNIVCVSDYTRESFISRYPSLNRKTISIYNLSDEKRIKRLSSVLIEDSRFDTSNFTIISLGRMDPIKRFSLIPSIARKIKERNIRFRWYILGGPENETYRTVERAIRENNVTDCVCLMGNLTNPYPYLKQAHLLVSTSSSEACPMIFNEAMLCGVPIVSADFGSAAEFISENVNGLVGPIEKLDEIIIEAITLNNQFKSRIIADNHYENNSVVIKQQLSNLFTL